MSRFATFARDLRDAVITRWQSLAQGTRWDVLAASVYTLVSLLLYIGASSKNPGSDGHYSWIFARSLAYDGDLDFKNDYALCGDPFGVGLETPAHRPANFFYAGPAVFWTPLVWILKHFVHGQWANGCRGTIPNIVLATSSLAGGVFVLATCAVVRRWYPPKIAALATLLVTLGGHLVYFTGMSPSYSHAYDAMCVALFVYFVVRAREAPERPAFVALAGLFLGLATLQRAIDLVFIAVAIAAFGRRWRASFGALAIACITGLLPVLAINHAVAGRWDVDTHGPHFLRFGHAHPLLLIFDQRGGVFALAPVLWLTLPGLVMLARRRDAHFVWVPFAMCAAFELWVSSAALDWQGARRLANTTPLAALALAAFLEPCVRWLLAEPRRMAASLALASLTAFVWGQACVSVGYRTERIPWDQPVSLGGRYGQGEVAILDETESVLGPLSAAPASWIFAARYGLRPSAYAWATHPDWYSRNPNTLDWITTTTSFGAPETRKQTRGLHVEGDDACFTSSRASFVTALQWPVATRARITYTAKSDATLSVSSRTFFMKATPWERMPLERGVDRDVYVHVPPNALDSGVNEILFEIAGKPADVCLRGFELTDDTAYRASPDSLASFPITIWHARQSTETRDALLQRIRRPSRGGRVGDLVVTVEQRGDALVLKVNGREKQYDHGSRPVIAIDAATGHGIEVHDGDPGTVWTHDFDVLR